LELAVFMSRPRKPFWRWLKVRGHASCDGSRQAYEAFPCATIDAIDERGGNGESPNLLGVVDAVPSGSCGIGQVGPSETALAYLRGPLSLVDFVSTSPFGSVDAFAKAIQDEALNRGD
jgi:hypothetical protein